MYDIQKSCEAQEQYCYEHDVPHFAPVSGLCFHCGRNIYELHQWADGHQSGITFEGAQTGHITGCPHCNFSFCE